MSLKRIIVENKQGQRRIVQPAVIPAGFKYVGPYDPEAEAKKKEAAAKTAQAGGTNDSTNGSGQGAAGNK
ncbi:hypothetical protein [Sporolactobacillus sp. KGMB 08714]|uniref:hypothetical protein n=1 Tax=Sporolactobacillus sp. KGMB 08714 TaxID=3064704 RepID=UPI002FBEE8A2